MSFTPTLKEAVQRVDGAVSASIIGIDGMPVEEYAVEKIINLDDLSAESSQMMKNIASAAASLGLGEASEFSIISDLCGIIMRKITSEYYLALIIRPVGNFGKGRFVMKSIVAKLVKWDLHIKLSNCPKDSVITVWYGGKMLKRLEPSSTHITVALKNLIPVSRPPLLSKTRAYILVCFWAPGYRFCQVRLKYI